MSTTTIGNLEALISGLVAQAMAQQNPPKAVNGKALPTSGVRAEVGNGVNGITAEVKANRAIATQAAKGTVAGSAPLRPPVQSSGQGMVSIGKGGKVLNTAGKTLEEQLAEALAENERLKATRGKAAHLSLKVSEKGAVSVYGLGRFPQTLYKEQWERLLAAKDDILLFIEENESQLSTKE